MKKEKLSVRTEAKSIYKRKLLTRVSLLVVAFLLLFLSILYGVLYIINTKGNFTISLDPNLKANKSIVISPTSDFADTPMFLKSDALDYMDNISETWLPLDLDQVEGEHNGNNYLAYTFFVKNDGEEKSNYRVVLNILSVIKNVDEAVRVKLYFNGEETLYAKKNSTSGDAEANTTAFISDTQVLNFLREDFEADEVDRMTVVIWLEGDDPDCVDNILGGEMKMELSLGEDK